jgi:F-type H+-transporting ATPase subunit b
VIDEVTLDMVLIQLVPFLVTLLGLHYIIFKPMLAHLADRERNIDGFKREAALLQEEVAGKVGELEAKLSEAKAEAAVERASLRRDSKAAEAAVVGAAREASDGVLTEARAGIATEKAAASKELGLTARSLSTSIASTILGRKVAEN